MANVVTVAVLVKVIKIGIKLKIYAITVTAAVLGFT